MALYIMMLANIFAVLVPMRAGILGRCLALLNLCDLYIYHVAISGGHLPSSLGLLGRLINPGLNTYWAETSTAIMMTLTAYIGLFAFKSSQKSFNFSGAKIKAPALAITLLSLAILITQVYIIAHTGLSELMSYTGYGSIKAGVNDASNISRIAGTTQRTLTLLLIAISIPRMSKPDAHVMIAMVPISISILLGIAEASRIVAIYFALAAICFFVTRQRLFAMAGGFLAIVCLLYAVEARGQAQLGLIYAPQNILAALRDDDAIKKLIANTSNRLLIVSISQQRSDDKAYSTRYKILSFLPSVNSIDGFQAEKDKNEQRIADYVPFSSLTEAYLFGPLYFLYFWLIVFLAACMVNRLAGRNTVLMLLGCGIFFLAYSFAGQYPIRNSIRLFYLIIALGFMFGRSPRQSKFQVAGQI
jgi:hypothetical protein